MRKPYTSLGVADQPTAKSASLPASVGGINAYDSLMMMPPQDCIYTFNLMPVEYGLRLRRGYSEWSVGAVGDVRTLIPYESASQDLSKNRLFSVTNQGIYNITVSTGAVSVPIVSEGDEPLITETGDDIVTEGGAPPALEVTFTQNSSPAGFGVYTEWTNDASQHYLFYADGLNGLFQYTEAFGWTVPTGWTYDDPNNPGTSIPFPVQDVAFIMAHKLRLWVILENSDDAYYSPVASVAGDFKKFTFGAKMPRGGYLSGLFTWSLDGGNGLDDYLVGISRSGDVLVYRGADPESADWGSVGSWFVGQIPRSRRNVTIYGSEMYILSSYGITSLRDLLQGSVANENRNSPSAKVNRFLRADVENGLDRFDWQMVNYPGDGFLQVITPAPANTPFIQYCQNTSTKAWGFWESVPIICGTSWLGGYYMGGLDGTVYAYTGVLDGASFSGDTGEPVAFRTLTSFQAPAGNQASYKRCGMIRTIGVLAGGLNLRVKAVFDYAVTQSIPLPPPASPNSGGSLWDSAVWDAAKWDDFGISGVSYLSGALGGGRVMAIGMSGSAASRINIVGFDINYTEGGFL